MIYYDPHDWRTTFTSVRGSMLKQIVYRVLGTTLSCGVALALRHQLESVAQVTLPHSLIGLALSLLLVFRTNASYDRFWEGRKLWGSIVNDCRNLARLSRTYLSQAVPELHQELLRWVVSFPFATMRRLRRQDGVGEARKYLKAEALDEVESAGHSALAVADKMSAIFRESHQRRAIDSIVLTLFEGTLQRMIDDLGACERIHRTPLPFAYVIHLRRALILYCITLPLVLVSSFGFWTVLVVLIVSYIFFGVEEIGVQIEDPFGNDDNDLPLEDLCKMIERNVLDPESD